MGFPGGLSPTANPRHGTCYTSRQRFYSGGGSRKLKHLFIGAGRGRQSCSSELIMAVASAVSTVRGYAIYARSVGVEVGGLDIGRDFWWIRHIKHRAVALTSSLLLAALITSPAPLFLSRLSLLPRLLSLFRDAAVLWTACGFGSRPLGAYAGVPKILYRAPPGRQI